MIRGIKLNPEVWFRWKNNSKIAANVIEGIPKRKEYLAASFLSQPDRSAIEIVVPDLDTPGITAKACPIPINKLSLKLWLLILINLFLELSAKNIKEAIIKETIPIEKLERRTLLKKVGIKNLISIPVKIIGTVPIIIEFKNLLFSKGLKNIFELRFLYLKISFLKYQNKARTLPSWIIADKEEPGSSIPKRVDATFKWAVLLTGINSVKPWIRPYKINLKYSKNLLAKSTHIVIVFNKNSIYKVKLKVRMKIWR